MTLDKIREELERWREASQPLPYDIAFNLLKVAEAAKEISDNSYLWFVTDDRAALMKALKNQADALKELEAERGEGEGE